MSTLFPAASVEEEADLVPFSYRYMGRLYEADVFAHFIELVLLSIVEKRPKL